MSAYCNQNDILGEIQMKDLIALTDDDPSMGVLNTTILNQVIANASGEIDRLVGNVYLVPFNPIPPSVESMATTMTCYRLLRRREVPDEKNKFFDEYEEIMKFLHCVHDREDVLDLSATQDFPQVFVNSRPTIYGVGNRPHNTM